MIMNATLLLRIAAVLTLLFGLGHSLGWPWVGALEGADLDRTLAITSLRVDTFGSMRSFMDFHQGFGLIISLGFLLQTVLFWYLSGLVKTDARAARPIIALFTLYYGVNTVLTCIYFFSIPIACSLLVTVSLGLAWRACGKGAKLS